MINHKLLITELPVSKPKPLVLAIRFLISTSFVVGSGAVGADVNAHLPNLSNSSANLTSAPVTVNAQGTAMTIDQKHSADKVTLDWANFNIDKGYSVNFDQTVNQVALNNIHQADASKILGSLTAGGQVYLINQNGFLFGKDSQVNVNSLVASTLGISDTNFQTGIVNVFDKNKTATLQGNGELYLKDGQGNILKDQNGQNIKIEIFVESGASIKTNAAGGRVILAAPSITNQGNISTPDGQTLLAASSDKVYLQEANGDPNIRGLLVEVGTGGVVNNLGSVIAERGNASLLGFAVNQQGVVSASTSVLLNGSVRLLAHEGIQDPTSTNGKLLGSSTTRATALDDGLGTQATVTLAKDSVTSVKLDADKTKTALDAQAQLRSDIEISGHKVQLLENSLVQAKSGNVTIQAVDNVSTPLQKGDARIYMAANSQVDVSGVKDVPVSVDKNIVNVELRKNELRDAPLQRNGILYTQKVNVDIRDATIKYDSKGNLISASIPTADITGAVARIARNIDERSISGGSVNLSSSGDVITSGGDAVIPASQIDISGGSTTYQGGLIQTTQLLSSGNTYDISQADPNRHYDSILSVKDSTRYSPGYVQGASGGQLTISGYEAVLQGKLQAQTILGALQRLPSHFSVDGKTILQGNLQAETLNGALPSLPSQFAVGSTLTIDLNNGNNIGLQDVVLGSHFTTQKLGADYLIPRKGLGSDSPIALNLDSDILNASKVGQISIKTNGTLTLNKDSVFTLPTARILNTTTFDATAQNFNILGSIISPSGSVKLQSATLVGDAIIVGATAKIDVSGLWVNDSQDIRLGKALSPIAIQGGQVSLIAEQGDLVLKQGSRISADGGAWKQNTGSVSAGNAGAIKLEAANHTPGGIASSLLLEGELSATALQWGNNVAAKGGSLTLVSNEVVIGATADVPQRNDGSVKPLVLAPSFFKHGGFSNYNITSDEYSINVAANAQVLLQQSVYNFSATLDSAPTGSYLSALSTPNFYAENLGLANPVNLTLTYAELNDQKRQESVNIGKGALIQTDIGGSITLNSDTSIIVDGTLNAPAGSINLNITMPTVDGGYFANQGIWLGADSHLLAKGAFKRTFNLNNLETGTVLSGGSVNLTANRGYIFEQAGTHPDDAQIDVSGISHTLDFMDQSVIKTSRNIASDGGSINFTAAEGIFAQGNMQAKSGGGSASGGSLSIDLNKNLRNKPFPTVLSGQFPDDINPLETESVIISGDNQLLIPGNLQQKFVDPNTQQQETVIDAFLSGKALFSSQLINQGNFGSINIQVDATPVSGVLSNAIVFNGNVNLSAERQIILDSPIIKSESLFVDSIKNQDGSDLLAQDGSIVKNIVLNDKDITAKKVELESAYLALGSTLVRNNSGLNVIAPDASAGNNDFTVNAQGIELIGGLSFSGLKQINLSSTGDLRLRGIADGANNGKDLLGQLNVAANLNITATQIYPATLTHFTINDSLVDATVSFMGNNAVKAPIYSAAGQLTVKATNINQKGVLEAPFGQLVLNATNNLTLASGSVTSVSGQGSTVLFGQGSGGVNWLYPINSTNNIVVSTPPEKRMELIAKHLDLQSGSTVNLSGGGDLYAYEFITGAGGTNDILDVPVSQKFAVIPGVNNILTPYDPNESSKSGLVVGQSVYLNAGAGLAAGWYTVLPAHYALLPNAYLITPKSGTQDQVQNLTNLAGATIVSGRYGVVDTAIANARTQGFMVQPGSIARLFSQYTDYSANQFFSKSTTGVVPQLPKDAGTLVLDAQSSLVLETNLLANPDNTGLGGQVDISADQIEVVANKADLSNLADGIVGLWVNDLNKLKAPSLLLGGKRSKDALGQHVTETASTVTIDANVDLKGQDIILTAINNLTVQKDATVESSGKSVVAGGNLYVNKINGGSDGALLRVSNLGQVNLIRNEAITANEGVLTIEEGAHLKASGSMLLDSTKNTVSKGSIDMQGGSLALDASAISLGAVPSNTQGLVLANTQFNLDELRLNSSSALNIYGSIDLKTTNLLISAAVINGFNNADGTEGKANISANTIKLSNLGASTTQKGNGTGELNLTSSAEILLGSGQYSISGFKQVNMSAIQAIKGLGQTIESVTGNSSTADPGVLNVAADLTLTAAYFGGDSASTTSINAAGYNVVMSSPNTSYVADPKAGLGSKWTVIGDSINSSAKFDLPSGILSLTALQQDLNLGIKQKDSNGLGVVLGSYIDLSGRSIDFSGTTKSSPGGSLVLVANKGNVNLPSVSSINLAGAHSVNGAKQLSNNGSLAVSAVNGQFNWQGSIDAKGGTIPSADFSQASLQLDVKNLGDFSLLNKQIAAAGFTQKLTLEQHGFGDLSIAASDIVKAQQINLAVDQGVVSIAGKLDASGIKAGKVNIYGRNGIILEGKGQIIANTTLAGATGGSVTLDTVHRNDMGSGLLNLLGGSVDVSGGAQGFGGAVHLRTGSNDANHINISTINSKILGSDSLKTSVEATRVYNNQTVIDAALINTLSQDTQTFMNTHPSLVNNSGAAVSILPGIEIRSHTDLNLANAWDLMTWRYADASGNNTLPGFLTLRAGGNLNVNASLSDAVATSSLGGKVYQDLIQSGQSWSYNLLAGGNVNLAAAYSAADPLSPFTNTDTQVVVRTGTGNINVNAGKDIVFNQSTSATLNSSNNASAIYTVGTTGYGELTQENKLVGGFLLAQYPNHGGDISLSAEGNIVGVQTGQQITDWQIRLGNAANPTSWGINISSADVSIKPVNVAGAIIYPKGTRNFNQNVGALGGGDVTVVAGGDVNNLSVMIPTSFMPGDSLTSPTGSGGDLTVTAGNNIVGGEFYTGLGAANLVAGGGITQSPINNTNEMIGVILDVGNANFNLQARQDINLAAVINPTIIKQNTKTTQKFKSPDARFFTYGANSAINLESIAGNLVLQNSYQAVQTLKNISTSYGTGFEYTVYPGILNAAALAGDIRIDNAMTLFPSAAGQLQLLANNNIGIDASAITNQRVAISMSDTDPALLPSVQNPVSSLEGNYGSGDIQTRELLDPTSPVPQTIHALTPLHQGDANKPLINARLGSISFPSAVQASIYLPQAANIIAGGNINNLSVSGQNLVASDVTLIKAGGNISFDAQLDGNGNVQSNDQQILLGGPGQLQVLAGQNISLGSSKGIQTIANIFNSVLGSNNGADINVLAGLADKGTESIAYQAFIDKYKTVAAYSSKLKALEGLSVSQQRQHLDVILAILFEEIKQAATAAASAPVNQRAALYKQGTDAVNTLFPNKNYAGDLSLVFSEIKTLGGGNVNLLVPGGKLDVGLAGKLAGISKTAAELGIVVEQQGNLNILASKDINVNQSRVFTLGGGDINAWSAQGSIDAGKGAKSAISAPAPVTTVDANGNIQTVFPPIISGSGIQAIGGGNVYLAAPFGIVDAGEAGISGGRVTIAATAVIGASNISSTSGTVGVPTTVSAPINMSGANGATASATKNATQSADDDNKSNNGSDGSSKKKVSIISADIVGFGDCSVNDVKEGKNGCGA